MGCPLGRCGPFTDDATQPSTSVYCRCGLHSVATTVTHSFVAAPHRARPALFASIALPVMRDVNELPPLRRANSLAPPAVVGNSEARGHPAPHDTRSPVRCSFATPRPHSPTSPPPTQLLSFLSPPHAHAATQIVRFGYFKEASPFLVGAFNGWFDTSIAGTDYKFEFLPQVAGGEVVDKMDNHE